LIEMLADWKAATERHHDGDLAKSLEIHRERFVSPISFARQKEDDLVATYDHLPDSGWAGFPRGRSP
jgi:hypothetical protein